MAAKLTRRETAAYAAMSDEAIARAWLRLDTLPRVKSGMYKGAPLRTTIQESERLITAAANRGMSLPCEGETMGDWVARMQRMRDFPEMYAY